MAAEPAPHDLTELGRELVQLRHRRAEARRRHERLVERIGAYTNAVAIAQARTLADEIAALSLRIAAVETRLRGAPR